MTFAKQGASVDPQATATDDNLSNNNADTVFLEVGDRKFSSKDEVVTKISNQDSHLKTVESENATLRDEVALLKANKEENTSITDELERMKQELSDKGLTPEQVQTLVSDTIATSKQSDLTQSNHTECTNDLIKAYGPEYINELSKKAAELGMSLDEADSMASTNPVLFRNTFIGSKQVAGLPNTLRSQGVNTAAYRETVDNGYEMKPPLSLRTTKERADNFLAALNKQLGS